MTVLAKVWLGLTLGLGYDSACQAAISYQSDTFIVGATVVDICRKESRPRVDNAVLYSRPVKVCSGSAAIESFRSKHIVLMQRSADGTILSVSLEF